MQPVQLPLTHAQAKLKWLLEQVHMVRGRSVNTHPSIADRNSVAGLSQQCGHNKEEKEKLHKMCNDYKARKVLLCCVVLAQPCETGEMCVSQVTIDQLHQFLQQQYDLKKQAIPPPPPPPLLPPQMPPAVLPQAHTPMQAVVAHGRWSRPRVKRGRDGAPVQGAG